MESEILSSLDYEAETVAKGTDEVQRVLAEFVADPSKAKLQSEINPEELLDHTKTTAGSADVTMATRMSSTHFADLLRGQDLSELVRINPAAATNGYGHLVALGPGGFFLCTCLRQLGDGLVCRHGIKAMHNKGPSFNGACVSPRWRESEKPWTLGALAARPARLAPAGAGDIGQLPTVDTDPDVVSHYSPTVSDTVHAKCLVFGEELATLCEGLNSVAGLWRVLENLKSCAKNLIEVEKRWPDDPSTSTNPPP